MEPVRERFPISVGDCREREFAATCVQCGVAIPDKVDQPVIQINCGALLMDNAERSSGGPSDMLDGFLDLWFHQGRPHAASSLVLAEHVPGGQVQLYLCSTRCLSRFFGDIVTEFERRIATAMNEAQPNPQSDPR